MIPRKYTDQEIAKLYDEYYEEASKTGITLKDWCEKKGLPYTSIWTRFARLEKKLGIKAERPKGAAAKRVGHDHVARSETAMTVEKEIAAEAKTRTELFLMLGKKIFEAYTAIAAKKGWDLSTIHKRPIDQEILEAFKKADEYDKLAKEYEELKEQMEWLRMRADPYARFELALNAYLVFLAQAVCAKAVGIDIRKTKAKEFFQRLIDSFLTGSFGELS